MKIHKNHGIDVLMGAIPHRVICTHHKHYLFKKYQMNLNYTELRFDTAVFNILKH
jgi:hypothetical protein